MPNRRRLTWRPVGGDASIARAEPGPTRAPTAVPRFTQLPTVADATTPLEDAIGLLQVAAEVEHALLVQYLYANASVIRSTGGMSVSGTLRAIAVEEMGHLVTVQNLLLALGGPAAHHFGRDVDNPDYIPVPFTLEPMDHLSLAKYVVVERPKTIADPAMSARVDALEAEVCAATNFDPNRVGALYAAIYWIVQPSDEPFGPESLSVADGFTPGWHVQASDFRDADAIVALATTVDEWRNFAGLIADVVTDSETGCLALHRVMAQGEGISASDDSHFEEFLAVLDAFDAGHVTVAPLPVSPYVAGQQKPGDTRATELTHPHTAPWGTLFNLVYSQVLACIAHGLLLPMGDSTRAELIDIALTAMRPVLGQLTRQIVKLPVTDPPDARKAGPPFGAFREEWPDDAADYAAVHQELLSREDDAIAAIRARPEHASDVQGRLALDAVEKLQTRVRALLP